MIAKTLTILTLSLLIFAAPDVVVGQTVDDLMSAAQAELDLWNHDEAVALYDQAIELDQGRHRVFFMRGMARNDSGDQEGALQDFDQALTLSPNEPEYLYERGMVRCYVQDYAGAVADFDAFEAVATMQELVLMKRADSKYQLDDYAGAAADYDAALAENPANPEIRYLRAFVRADMEDWDGAVADFTAVMTMEPIEGAMFDSRDRALLRRAQVKIRAADFEGAQADCDQALALDADDLEARFIRAKALVGLEKYADAIADLDVVIERYPMPEAVYDRGMAKQLMGDVDGADADLNQAAEMGFTGSEE